MLYLLFFSLAGNSCFFFFIIHSRDSFPNIEIDWQMMVTSQVFDFRDRLFYFIFRNRIYFILVRSDPYRLLFTIS